MDLEQLLNFLVQGGLEVNTEIVAPDKPAVLLRTVVHLDGDVITWVAGAQPSPEDWAQHQKTIDKFLNQIRWLRRILRYGWILLSAVFMIISGAINIIQGEIIRLLVSLVLIPALFFTIRWGAVNLLQTYLRRKIEAYTRGLVVLSR